MRSASLSRAALRSTPLLRPGALAVLTFLALAGPFAATGARGQEQAVVARVDVEIVARGYRASTLLHRPVHNSQNQQIGTIDDIIIGHDDRALFAILQVGGFLGIGGHLVAVPYQSKQFNDQSGRITLPGATQAALRGLQEFRYRR